MELLIFFIVIILDQLSKIWVGRSLALGQSVPVFENVFHITNVHNTGAAWGMMAGGRVLFLIFTPVFCGALIWFLLKNRSRLTMFGRICITLLIAGAVGNFIDRVWLAYVRDMFDLCLIHFPVFNVADSAITIGAFMLVIDTLFHKGNSIMDMLEKDTKNEKVTESSDPEGPDKKERIIGDEEINSLTTDTADASFKNKIQDNSIK